ncbi:S-adenosyl-L-methionine-dependent methyltransferase [Lophiostoma macrostomum CBS 122681]|uniref:S-adenosyl-L-methionine-dependent methyltransferase n=1 Tax=Lophiostoma macrostomum CBS 122681 TaxID=1314788 RepID=A0A6A6TCE7_9PLEO|nr:S-adenosyl-L-methionine-dependent methyltransferase [Lophiostoma macrostomum CBS 122681]
MAQSEPQHQVEKTFRAYNEDQAEMYAQSRLNYSPEVYKTILDHHKATGGQMNTLIDIGCGPGLATRPLAPHFTKAFGLDPSEGMIAKARSLSTESDTNIHFEVSTAEELGSNLSPRIEDASVDLITAANAAHWFNLPPFWRAAARVLKPGGTVALWTSGGALVHPEMPNADAIQKLFDWQYIEYVKPYLTPGNIIAREAYVNLPLPWTISDPVKDFEESAFVRRDWGAGEQFQTGVPEEGVTLDTFEKITGTGSAITRWRQDHPDLVGTEKDVLRVIRREIERLLHEAGVEKGKERVKGAMQGAVLLFKKKA